MAEEKSAPKKEKAPKKEAAPVAAGAETNAPAAEKPVKEKAPKAAPVLNKAQQEFQNTLNGLQGEAKQKYSAKVAKQLGIKLDEKGDARIDHMRRCMAIKAHLGTMSDSGKKAKK